MIEDGHYCTVAPGINLHYARCGAKDAPLLLLVHGFPEFWFAWAHVMPAFAEPGRSWHPTCADSTARRARPTWRSTGLTH